ncbi:DUF928 domain-containing protein [Oscillatoria sp. FACHB-1407]|uniref:DUF928 domain-containing protein n=1 Tax=Oscillatoria sp. FACHB-1407 TaxID=2692847 RepID=UPI00168667F0|nr:DUF928 domain-containing protein [Oscillatoria sp. FACHB-1407]MBD2463374.1 DUF928 domain-containing protein [Oscillatoria sp. FACHB-1407]
MARLFLRLTTFSASLFLGLMVPIGFSNVVLAQGIQFNAPSIGAPGNRESGASRSSACATSDRGLKALLPETNVGLTTEARPTFFAYIPPSSANSAEFILYEDGTDELIYSTALEINGESGIASISLPSGADTPMLEVNKTYYWYFTVICDADDRSADMTVQGSIRRVPISSDLARQLASASTQERPAVYAAAGIWQDALAALAALNNSEPNNPNTRSSWNSLLSAVGLQDIADEQILTGN